ncbi:BtrH N-terminal domain-containing protein [Paenibacillus chitinolyticus]|uniref:BtrH N-terminal domain-containing protein n=1 Tax=Paenibacillus chitinolyticus TaxID=79263 RepID=UPI0036DE14A7
MIKNIQVINSESMTCLESILATVLSFWDKDYKMMWAESWGFSYKSDDNIPIGERINPDKKNIFESIEIFYGIKIKETVTSSVEEIIEAINRETNNGVPVCIYIDAFWCSWFPLYQKQHLERYCLALAIDQDKIYCLDPQFSEEVQILNLSDFSNGFREYMTFDESVPDPNIFSAWKNSLYKNLEYLLDKTSAFDMMREFADAINNIIDLSKEVSHYNDINSVHLFRRLVYISSARKNYAEILKLISVNYNVPELIEYSNELTNVSKKWKIVERTFFKSAFMKKKGDIYNQISNIVYEIAMHEEKIAIDLKTQFFK